MSQNESMIRRMKSAEDKAQEYSQEVGTALICVDAIRLEKLFIEFTETLQELDLDFSRHDWDNGWSDDHTSYRVAFGDELSWLVYYVHDQRSVLAWAWYRLLLLAETLAPAFAEEVRTRYKKLLPVQDLIRDPRITDEIASEVCSPGRLVKRRATDKTPGDTLEPCNV